MPALTRKLLDGSFRFPPEIELPAYPANLPERVVQFGEGNFLRAFVDWMFQRLNNSGLWSGSVVVVQPIADGLADRLAAQDGLYTLILRGLQDGRPVEEMSLVGAVSRALSAYDDWDEVLKCAENPTIEYLVSNTTEAGIAHNPGDTIAMTPPVSFPAKVTAYLYRRFRHFGGDSAKGMVIIPCELTDRNGDLLKQVVLRYAAEWRLPAAFAAWVEKDNFFLNTLVDRVVTGYPKDEADAFAARLGYQDALLDTGELFHLWVIEGPARVAEKLPFTRIGLNVIWTDDMTPYRTRKVRILNGSHTASVPTAFLCGIETVGEMMDHPVVGQFVRQAIYDEIVPAVDLDKKMLRTFADAVVERFQNPYIRHYLTSILLNSAAKFKVRVLPSILDHQRRFGRLPARLVFGLAALIAVYKKPGVMRDDQPVLDLMAAAWSGYDGSDAGARRVVDTVLANRAAWGEDLTAVPGMAAITAGYLQSICRDGAPAAVAALLAENRA